MYPQHSCYHFLFYQIVLKSLFFNNERKWKIHSLTHTHTNTIRAMTANKWYIYWWMENLTNKQKEDKKKWLKRKRQKCEYLPDWLQKQQITWNESELTIAEETHKWKEYKRKKKQNENVIRCMNGKKACTFVWIRIFD